MKKAWFAIALSTATLLPMLQEAIAGEIRQLRPVQGIQFSSVQYLKAATQRDPKLEQAIRQVIPSYQAPASDTGERPVRYYYNRVDLNGDGSPEVVVYLGGAYTCGSGGCTALIFQTKGRNYGLVSQHTLMNTPILVTPQRTAGWNDLVVLVAGGGAPAHYARLRFNGKTYPGNPSVQPAVPAGTTLKGKALVADEDPNTGLVLPPR
jgi:hypothetical protein